MSNDEKRIIKPRYLTEEEIKEQEDEMDTFELKQKVQIKGITIKTIGDLRPYIKSTKIARKFEDFLHEDDFEYIYNWILRKEFKNSKLNK
jgi:hypothetical protein